jgi:hypothetical protein
VLRMGAGEVRQQRARVYQQLATGRRDVAARFEVGADGLVSLALGEYDRSLPLVVDPVLSYVYFFESGHKHDQINDMVVGADGSVYVVGETASSDFPVTPGAFDTTASLPFFSSDVRDAFVAKLDPAGSSLVYSTFLGSFGDERAYGAALGPSGTVFAVGFTDSADFPTTPGAYDTTFNTVLRAGDEFGDVFVVELAADGASLVYSTFLGGSNSDAAYTVAVDAAGAAYVIGLTWSADYPTTPGAFDTTLSGGDVFVTKVNAGGASLAYSTLVGGLQGDFAQDVAVDASGNAYVRRRPARSATPRCSARSSSS